MRWPCIRHPTGIAALIPAFLAGHPATNQIAAITEYHHTLKALLLKQVYQQALLIVVRDEIKNTLVNIRLVFNRDFNLNVDWVNRPLIGQIENIVGKGGRKQERLALFCLRRVSE